MKFSLTSFILLLITSCASTKVVVNSPNPNGIPVEKLNLMSVMIGPLAQPTFPLIDAAAFNEKTNKIADQILDEEQKLINRYKETLVSNLQNNLNAEIVLQFNSDGLENFIVNEALPIENKNFPVVFFAENDFNFVEWDNGKNINRLFKDDNPILKESISKVSEELGLKTVVLSFNRLAVVGVGAFGSSGVLRLESYIFIYNSNGKLVMDSYGWMKPTKIRGNDIREYKLQLDGFVELARLSAEELAKYLK